jgi:hypothetical protein
VYEHLRYIRAIWLILRPRGIARPGRIARRARPFVVVLVLAAQIVYVIG